MFKSRNFEQSLRGGGSAPSNNNPQEISENIQTEANIHSELLNKLLVELNKRCQQIENNKQILSTEEGKSILCRNISWFEGVEELLYYFQFQLQLLNRHKQMIEKAFQILLEQAFNTIEWDRFITLKILKICNFFSRLLFVYYINFQQKSQQQQIDIWKEQTTSIIDRVNQDGETTLLYNGLTYELTLIQNCIEYIPTNTESKIQDNCVQNFLIEIGKSAFHLKISKGLGSAIEKGALYLYQQYKKKKSLEQFQNCFYLEYLKQNIFIRIKADYQFKDIEESINNKYIELIKKRSDWAIQYSWIKMASEIMACKPQITKLKFQKLQEGLKQSMTWEQAQSQKLINVINKDFEIAEIIQNNSTTSIGIKLRMIQQQYLNLQNLFMNGNQVIPKFIGYYSLEFGKDQLNLDDESNQEYLKMIQSLRQLPIEKIAFNYTEFRNKFLIFLDQYYQKENERINFTDFQQHLVKVEEFYQSLLNDIIKLQISREYSKKIIEIIYPILIKLDQKRQSQIDPNCFQTFLYNYSKIQNKQQLDKNKDILADLIDWLQEKNLYSELYLNYQQRFGKKIPEDCFFLSKIQENSFQVQLNSLTSAIEFCQQRDYLDLAFQFTDEHLEINKQIMITKQTQEEDEQQKLINEFQLRQLKNFQNFYASYIILQMESEFFCELKILLFDKFSVEEFEKIKEKKKIEKIEFNYDFNFDINQYFQYQINQHKQLIQLLESEQKILKDLWKEYEVNKNSQIFKYFFSIFNQSLESINQIFNFYFDSIKIIEKLIEYVNRKHTKQALQSVKSNYNELDTYIDILIKTKDKIDSLNNDDYGNKMKELQNSVSNIQQLILNNCDYKPELLKEFLKELNMFSEFIHNITQNEQHSTINNRKGVTKQLIEKIEKLYKDLKQSMEDLNAEMINESKPNQIELLNNINNFKQDIKKLQQSITFPELDGLQDNLCLMKFTDQTDQICIQCKEQISKLTNSFQQFLLDLRNLNYEKFCKDDALNDFILNNQKELERQLKDELNFIFQPIQYQIQANLKQCKQSIADSIIDFIYSNSWRVKEGFIFQCIQLENQLQEQNKQTIQQILILIAAKETNLKILVTLKNKQILQQLYQGFSKSWPSVQNQIQQDLVNQIIKLEQLYFNIQNAETDRKRELLLKEHKQLEETVEQQILNVNQIGDALGITINFLREIKQDLNKIQQKLDQMLNKIDQVALDIKQLIGKTPQQLLEIRMQSILQEKIINDFNNVYVNLRTKELKENFKDEDDETTLFNDISQNKGEIDEYLQQPKDSLLIHGPAGSGKSVAARKIEEYLWLQYQQLNIEEWSKDLEQIPVVPIFIQLASLKDPYCKAIEETLTSTNYNFDMRQFQAFKTQVEEGKVAVIFILDSFDELTNNQINLIETNKLKNWKLQLSNLSQSQQNIHKLNYPKIITTTRSEVFELNSINYRKWFSSSSQLDFIKYKELRILSFDDNQKQEYLKQYSYIQIKQTLLDHIERYSLIKKRGRNLLNEVEKIWNNILVELERFNNYQQQNNQNLSDKEINIIISKLKKGLNLKNNQDSFPILERLLKHIFTPQFFNKNIQDFNLEQLLKTPFMMKIVIDVLPQINAQKQEIQQEHLIGSYTNLMYEKYVKNKTNEEIIQFDEKISIKQYKEDQQLELNNQSIIQKQQEEGEKEDVIGYQQEKNEDQQLELNNQSIIIPIQQKEGEKEDILVQELEIDDDQHIDLNNQTFLPKSQQDLEQGQKVDQIWPRQRYSTPQDICNYPFLSQLHNKSFLDAKLDIYKEEEMPQKLQQQQDQLSTQLQQSQHSRQQIPKNYQQFNSYKESPRLPRNSQIDLNHSGQFNTFSHSQQSILPNPKKPFVNLSANFQNTSQFAPQRLSKYSKDQNGITQKKDQSQIIEESQSLVNTQQVQPEYYKDSLVEQKLKQQKIRHEYKTKIKQKIKEQGERIFKEHPQFSQQYYDQLQEDKQILLKCYKSFKLTQYHFYQQFLENYIINQMQKLSTIQQQKFHKSFINEINEYSTQLALYLMENQQTSMQIKKTSNLQGSMIINQNQIDQRFYLLFNSNKKDLYLIKKCLPLKENNDILSFEHKSIQEFIYASLIISNLNEMYKTINKLKEMIRELGLKKQKSYQQILECFQKYCDMIQEKDYDELEKQFVQSYSKECLELAQNLNWQIYISPLNCIVMANQFYLGTIRFVVEYMQNNEELKLVLHFLIELKYGRNIQSNSIQLLTYMQELFLNKDFSKISIYNVKLLGMKCIRCNFTGSNFENVTLMGSNFHSCTIADVKWNIISQDLPTLHSDIGSILKASYSFDGSFIAALSLNKTLVIYQTTSGERAKDITLQQEVLHFCWFNTRSRLAYVTGDKLQIFCIERKKNKSRLIKQNLKISETVNMIKVSNQDNYLLIGCQNGKIIIYEQNLENDKIQFFREILGEITAFDISPNEVYVIASDKSQVFSDQIQEEDNTKSKIKLRELKQDQQVKCIVFSPDGYLIACAASKQIIIYRLVKFTDKIQLKDYVTLIGHQDVIRCISFSCEGNLLVSGGDDKSVRIWDYRKGKQIGEYLQSHSDVINSVELSKPDGMIILSAGNDGQIKQWHHSDNYRVNEYLPGHDGSILFMIISQDSQSIITKGQDKKIIQWNIKTASIVNQIINLQSCQECSVNKLCAACQKSPIISINDDQYIITGGFGHSIAIYDSYTGQQTNYATSFLKPKGEVRYLAQSQKHQLICSGTQNGDMIIWDINKKIHLKKMIYCQILTLFFDLEQKLIVLNSQGEYKNIDFDFNDKNNKSLSNDNNEWKKINQQIFGGIADQQIEIDYQNSQQQSNNNKVQCLALTSDYSYLAIATNENKVFILETKDLSKIIQEKSYMSVITSMYFNQNGLILILSFEDLSIGVWDILKKQHRDKSNCHQNMINCLVLSSDNEFMISTSQDNCIKIWKMENLNDTRNFSNISGLQKKLEYKKESFETLFDYFNEQPENLEFQINQLLKEKSINQHNMNGYKLEFLQNIEKAVQYYNELSELRNAGVSASLIRQKPQIDEKRQLEQNIENIFLKNNQIFENLKFNMIRQTQSFIDQIENIKNMICEKKQYIEQYSLQEKSDCENDSDNDTFYEIFCISKTPQNINFKKSVFTNSSIKNQTNHDMMKLWQKQQDKDNQH